MTAPDDERTIIVEDDAWAQGFTQVPNVILRSRTLSIGAKVAYGVLLSYAWQDKSCFPGQERMARDMGSGIRSVVRYLAELEESGVVVITRRGQGKTNLYTLPRLIGDPRAP